MPVVKVRFRNIKYLLKITELARDRKGFESWSIQNHNLSQTDLGLKSPLSLTSCVNLGGFLNFSEASLHLHIFKMERRPTSHDCPEVKYLRQALLKCWAQSIFPLWTCLEWAVCQGPELVVAGDTLSIRLSLPTTCWRCSGREKTITYYRRCLDIYPNTWNTLCEGLWVCVRSRTSAHSGFLSCLWLSWVILLWTSFEPWGSENSHQARRSLGDFQTQNPGFYCGYTNICTKRHEYDNNQSV